MTLHEIVCAMALAALLPQSYAGSFDIKTGAWEVTSATAMSGMSVPKDVLDRMAPAQRARMEAAMAARAGKASAHASTTCVTKQDLERGQIMKSDDANCKRKVLAQNSSHYEIEETCAGPDPSTTRATFDAKSTESYTAVIDRTQGKGGKVRVEMTARWLGATCKKGSGD